jgi:CRP-like cAMP-binding protein
MLYEVHEGEHVGEGSLLARKPSPAHVVAVSDCELVTLPPKELYEIAGAFPALWARLKDIAEKRERAFRQLLG